jgi:hypothetical protein
MSVGAVPFDPSGLGTDINLGMSDLAGVWGEASGLANLGNAWLRRLCCPPGGLFYDSNYGSVDIVGMLNGSFTPADIAGKQSQASAEIEKDERCDTCACSINLNAATQTLTVTLTGTLVTGQPFQFVIAVSNLTVALLSINGVLAPGSAIAAATPAGGSVQLVVGPPGMAGGKGDKGDVGTPGTAQVILDFDESDGGDDSGSQVVIYQRLVNFDALLGTVTFELVADVSSAAGTATFRMSYGGTSRVADGTPVGSPMTTGSSTPVPLNVSATIANPGGLKLVKITVQSSANGVMAKIADRTLTIR